MAKMKRLTTNLIISHKHNQPYLKNFPSLSKIARLTHGLTLYMLHITDDRAGAVRDGPAAALRDDRGRAAEELLLPAARVPAV